MSLSTDVLHHHPANDTERGCGVCVESCHHRADSAVECAASVEAEPSKPDEDSTDEDERGVVGLSVDLVSLVKTFSEDKGIGKCRPSRCDVDRATSGKVEGRKVEQPTVAKTRLVL